MKALNCMHVCECLGCKYSGCACMYFCEEYSGCPLHSPHFLRQDLSPDLMLTVSARAVNEWTVICLSLLPNAGIIGACGYFYISNGCWRFKLRSCCFYKKCSYPLRHLLSPLELYPLASASQVLGSGMYYHTQQVVGELNSFIFNEIVKGLNICNFAICFLYISVFCVT